MNEAYYMKAVEALGKRINELELDVIIKDLQIDELKKKLECAENAAKGKE